MDRYRVLKSFNWAGWHFAPNPDGICECQGSCGNTSCENKVASSCLCNEKVCRCTCRIKVHLYGGDIWLAEERNPRVGIMLQHRFAVSDPSIESLEVLLTNPLYMRLLSDPSKVSIPA